MVSFVETFSREYFIADTTESDNEKETFKWFCQPIIVLQNLTVRLRFVSFTKEVAKVMKWFLNTVLDRET